MAWTKFQFTIVIMMVCTGTLNTVAAKWVSGRKANCKDGEMRYFNHPYLQSACMFIGEMILLVVYKLSYFICEKKGYDVQKSPLTRGNRDFNVFILLVPAWCDMTGTTLMLIGLVHTYASSFQMLRGSLIVFTGLLTLIFLKRALTLKSWLGIALVIIGMVLVGVADFIIGGSDTSGYSVGKVILGDALIICGQLIVAIQMVYEEKYVKEYDINACQAIGWEGIFGFVTITILQIPMYWIPAGDFSNNSRDVAEDAPEAFIQMEDDNIIILLLLVYLISVCFFNFAGISITKELSATTRTVLDSVRTLFVYLFSLFLFKQQFHWLQILGFVALLMGMYLYNNIPTSWLTKWCKKSKDGDLNEGTNEGRPKQLASVE